MEEDEICAVKCANESDVCVKTKEEANRNAKSGFFIERVKGVAKTLIFSL